MSAAWTELRQLLDAVTDCLRAWSEMDGLLGPSLFVGRDDLGVIRIGIPVTVDRQLLAVSVAALSFDDTVGCLGRNLGTPKFDATSFVLFI